MSVVVVLDPLTAEQCAALQAALPDGTAVEVGDDRAALGRAQVLLSHHLDVDEQLLTSTPSLRAVIKIDSYMGTVDEVACSSRGIAIHRVPMISLISVAEHAVMLMLALEKQLIEAERMLRDGIVVGGIRPEVTTQDSYAYNWVGLERFESLYGRRIGLVGMGTIGRAVAERLRGFEVGVVASTRRALAPEDEAAGIQRVPFDELLATSDHVSLHVKFEPSNERLMGAREFELMKPGAFFINTARGRLVDEDALVASLNNRHLGGAALDVFWHEPLKPDSALLRTPNTILSPHTAGIPAGVLHPAEIPLVAAAAKGYLDGA